MTFCLKPAGVDSLCQTGMEFVLFCMLSVIAAHAAQPVKPKWIRVSSDHFSVLTDADDKKAREVAVRFEQMRAVFGELLLKRKVSMSEPIEILAFRNDKEYADIAPVRAEQVSDAPGLFLPGSDRNFIGLNLSQPHSWEAIYHPLAHYYLNYNYPPTQSWFDEGFAEYFASVKLTGTQAAIGSDPELSVPWNENISGNQIQKRHVAQSFIEQLNTAAWLPITDLFSGHSDHAEDLGGIHDTLFHAQSWMVVHYLLNQNKLAETGTYFDLVENKKVSIAEAIQQAYGKSVTQFDQAVKDYFKALKPLFLALEASKRPDSKSIDLNSPEYQVSHVASLDAENVGTSVVQIADPVADASVAEMELRLPEHRLQAETQLKRIVDDQKTANAIAYRALAWAHMQKKEFDPAHEELNQASQLDPKDPWVHYYLALIKYEEANGGMIPGLANFMQDLRAVIDWNPEFAEAYDMLAVARLQGGGVHSAMDAIRPAIQFSPRNQTYLLNLAQIEMAGKQWEDAVALLSRLRGSSDLQIARAAKKDLADLPTLKKYGVLPQADSASKPGQVVSSVPESEPENSETKSASPVPSKSARDTRPIKFLKGTLLSVDCSHAPMATLNFTSSGKVFRLRTADYKSLLMIGAENFSCDWRGMAATVNYKALGKNDGDLVSLEVR